MSGKDNYKELPNDTTLEYNEMVNNTTERFQKEKSLTEKKNCRRPKNIESRNTKISYHTKDTKRKQSTKTCYKLHQLSHF